MSRSSVSLSDTQPEASSEADPKLQTETQTRDYVENDGVTPIKSPTDPPISPHHRLGEVTFKLSAVESRSSAIPSPLGEEAAETVRSRSAQAHHRTPSAMSTASRFNKRFSVQPQPQPQAQSGMQPQPQSSSPTHSTSEPPYLKFDSSLATAAIGEEPGINVDTMVVDIPDSVGSKVTIVDYSQDDCQITSYDVPKNSKSIVAGSSDRRMLGQSFEEALDKQPTWSRVRWIVVNGLSWEAIRPVAMKYNLHPLALEDMLDIPQRTKIEAFREQVFCCFPLQTLHITPTPFSLMHSIARRSVLKVYQGLCAIAAGFQSMLALLVACYTALASRISRVLVRRSGGSDVEQATNHTMVCPVHGMVHEWDNSTCSSDTSVFSLPHKEDITNDFVRGVSTETRVDSDVSSEWSTPVEVSTVDAEECIPFYTCDFGTLCSNMVATPIEDALHKLPARSMYEWNRGNVALHQEALQNMRIQGSANSVEIALEQVSLFLLPNTVITIFEKSAPSIYEPIKNRLMSPLTMLRQSCDASILVQAIFDTNVDLLRPIIQEYRTQLGRLQVEGIHQPNLRHTRALHAFMTDLSMMRTLVRSLTSLVDAFRSKSTMRDFSRKNGACADSGSAHTSEVVSGSISAEASEYFTDVVDHSKMYLEDLDVMHAQSKTLSSLIFDTISIRAGDSVKMLSLVSVIFLPLTFLTGYFGMNFKSFTILDHDVGYYWLVSTPAAAALTTILMYPTIKSQLREWWSWAKLQV